MTHIISHEALQHAGMTATDAQKWHDIINQALEKNRSRETAWQMLSVQLREAHASFAVHHATFSSLFPDWQNAIYQAPVWTPNDNQIQQANITQFMSELDIHTIPEFHTWTRQCYPAFWEKIIAKLSIQFKQPATAICDLSAGVTQPKWLPGASLNIADSCFSAQPDMTALIYENGQSQLATMTYGELNQLSNQIANSLVAAGYTQGDAIAIAMPMSCEAIAAFLGIIKMGGVVVSIADSFSSEEIAVRLNIARAKGIFTQDFSPWASKLIPIYEKVTRANAPRAIVFCTQAPSATTLRDGDVTFTDFLVGEREFTAAACDPLASCIILFSSGTTGDPKAIPWNHTTAIKAASDAFFHQNIQPNDVLAWPTNLGWMMGPWLVFAALINRAAIALFAGAPKGREFGEFVVNAGVTMLGVVPTLVACWRQTQCMEGLNWQCIKTFSSTGECSNPDDMFYLMWLAGYKPVIEYCGGTEIGGAYVSSTVVQNNYPSLFTTPTMGCDFTILDESGVPSDVGEVAIIPPSLGLSLQLLNADHTKVYYTGMPSLDGIPLRRHGDQICRYPNGTYSILGRVDDTMNLGGIKISAAEIERAIADITPIRETAAIAITPPNNGPSLLVIYAAVSTIPLPTKSDVMTSMQQRINVHLNPLFKIYDLVFVDDLPKTASNKIMRRLLRKEYMTRYA